MYKLVAIDIDGTLLNDYGEITQRTKEALLRAQEIGVVVVLASGRITSSTLLYAKNIGLNKYVIAGNGSVIHDIAEDKDIYTDCIGDRSVENVIRICKENSISFNVYTLEDILTEKIEYNVLFYNSQNRELPDAKKNKIVLCSNLEDEIKRKIHNNVSKITICDKDKSIFNSIIRKLRAIKTIQVLDVSHASHKIISVGSEKVNVKYYYTEVSKPNVDKWNSIKYIANVLNIKDEEIIAIGDNANDILMARNAGLGAIMSNAADVYKQNADYIAPSNNDDGVADVLEKFIFNN